MFANALVGAMVPILIGVVIFGSKGLTYLFLGKEIYRISKDLGKSMF